MSKPITLVAAMAYNGAIGRGGEMPWHYPADFAHFKRVTMGATLIMGRATWDSIGRPLPGRETVVLTRDASWSSEKYPQVKTATSLGAALALAEQLPGPIVIAGGSQVYEQAMAVATHQILTHLPLIVEGADAYYPKFAQDEWTEVERVSEGELLFRWLERV